MWIVTSTVFSSSLASIMRTLRRRAARGGERLQHLGVPGVGDSGGRERFLVDRRRHDRRRVAGAHERDRALDRGAPRRRRRGRRRGRAARSRGRAARPGTCSTGMQPRGSAATSPACSIAATGSSPPVNVAARRITPTSPTTNALPASAERNQAATISGPMPHASPIVRASGRGAGSEAMRHCEAQRATIMTAHFPFEHAQGLAPVLADGDDRGCAAVRRRDAQARLAEARAGGGRHRPGGVDAGGGARGRAAGSGAQRLADRSRNGGDELCRGGEARGAGGRQHHREPAPRARMRRPGLQLLLRPSAAGARGAPDRPRLGRDRLGVGATCSPTTTSSRAPTTSR